MLAGMGDLLSVTGEVAVVSESPVTVDPTTTSDVGLILPAWVASLPLGTPVEPEVIFEVSA
jgi:hypothetical protein